MGKHYTPREYLRGFTKKENPNQIWAYNNDGNCFEVSIEKIAQENDMYSDDTEAFLTQEVENPANILLNKLREKELLERNERNIFSKYMYNLISRTPDSYSDYIENASGLIEELRVDEVEEINKIIDQNEGDIEALEKVKNGINKILDEFKENPPKEIWENSINPNLSERTVPALSKMTWIFFYEEYDCFVTCDRPLFYFKSLGIGNKNSEITFPISSRIVLWGSWRSDLKEGFYKAKIEVIKTINYRTLSNVYRHAFFCSKKDWISKAIQRKDFPKTLIK